MARGSLFTRVTDRVTAIIRAARGPETSRIADIPGQGGHYGARQPPGPAEKLLESWGVMSSRVAPNAGPTKTRWALWPGDNLTPETIIGAQREAITSGIPLRWVELVDQVYSRDGHYASCTTQRVADVVKGTWRLAPSTDDDAGIAACNFTDEVYRSCSRWKDGLGWLLYANLYSYNAIEVEWTETAITFPGPKGETIGPLTVAVPARLHNVHPKHFRFDLDSDDPLFWIGNGYQPLPYGKFVFLDGEGLHPTKVRRGHAWQCIWYSLFRSMGWAAWGVHVDRFSLPVPIIEYDGDVAQYEEYKAAYLDILTRLGQGLGVVLPRGAAKFDIHNPPSGGTAGDPASALSDACDAGQSIRVLGGQLNNKIGNVGSFAASSNHIDIKYGLEELDADRAWERIDEQLGAPLLRFNAEAIATALNAKGYNVTPEQIMRRVPKGKHHIPGKTDPMIEMQIMDMAVNKLGLPLSVAGAFARMDFQRARDDQDRIKGEAQPLAKGGALVTTADAADEGGIVNEDPAAEAKAAEVAEPAKTEAKPEAKEEAPKPEPAKPEEDEAARMERAAGTLAELARGGAIVHPRDVFRVFGVTSPVQMEGEGDGGGSGKKDQLAEFGHAQQPRDANGRFAPVAGAKSSVADHVARHLKENGHDAEAKGSTVHLKSGATIEIGANGERQYSGTKSKVQASVESHLRAHPDKHVRDWASKTSPPPPPPRKVDPVKAAARAKAHEEKQAAKTKEKAARTEAREAKRTERTAAKDARAKAVTEKKTARAEKQTAQREALRALGAPVTAEGKIDASKVPGATKSFTPPTSADPANSFRGRSFVARSAAEMKSEFLGAVGRGGSNEGILVGQAGHLGVRDKTQWEAINEKYEANAETFDEAFKVLAKASGQGTPNKRPDWRNLDLDALRGCAGLEGLEMPTWIHESQLAEGELEHYQSVADEGDIEDYTDAEPAEHHPGADASVPF